MSRVNAVILSVLIGVVLAGQARAERWLLVKFQDSDTASTFGTNFPT